MAKKLWGIVFIIIVIAVGINYKSIIKIFYPIHYESIVTKYADGYMLDRYIIYSLIRVESKFDPDAISNRDAVGLMQITPQTGKYISRLMGDINFNKNNLYDPEINIKYGCFYLKKLLTDFDGDMNCALAAYNGGEGNVRKWLRSNANDNNSLKIEDIPFKETRDYIKRINRYYDVYKFIYKD